MFAARPILRIKKLARPLGSWLGFSALYAMTSGFCPCCGQLACPNGLLGAGLVGTIFALVIQFRARISR